MLYDQLRETWAFKEIWEEGWEEGRQKGLEKGLSQGLSQGLEKERATLRRTALALIEKRFPLLLRMAKDIVAMTLETEALEQMILDIGMAQTVEEAQAALLDKSADGKN